MFKLSDRMQTVIGCILLPLIYVIYVTVAWFIVMTIYNHFSDILCIALLKCEPHKVFQSWWYT